MQIDNKKILVADDDDDVRKILSIFLTFAGYNVDCVNDGEEAMRSLEKNSYSLLITDYMMPKLNGIELIKRVKGLNLSLPIIGISGSDNEKEFLAVGARLFMTKPITLSILGNALERELSI